MLLDQHHHTQYLQGGHYIGEYAMLQQCVIITVHTATIGHVTSCDELLTEVEDVHVVVVVKNLSLPSPTLNLNWTIYTVHKCVCVCVCVCCVERTNPVTFSFYFSLSSSSSSSSSPSLLPSLPLPSTYLVPPQITSSLPTRAQPTLLLGQGALPKGRISVICHESGRRRGQN